MLKRVGSTRFVPSHLPGIGPASDNAVAGQVLKTYAAGAEAAINVDRSSWSSHEAAAPRLKQIIQVYARV
jgi:hypothetical protein